MNRLPQETVIGMADANAGRPTPAVRLGIYVQVPFCQTKCTYCNFHTGVVSEARFAPYVAAVCREIREWNELYRNAGLKMPWVGVNDSPAVAPSSREASRTTHTPVVDTIYIGGGTPSLLAPELLARVTEAIRETFATAAKAAVEATLEADPETVTEEKARAWRAAGINRISFGVQSFVDKELAAAGRMHRREDVYRAHAILRATGIANVSFDLIAGLPWQTRASWRESLEEVRTLSPEHVSVYLLEVDEESRLGKELIKGGPRYSAGGVPSDDEMAEFYETACAFLREAGYEHYEISNWAKPGCASRHNLKYWDREAYLGFGAGAHSFSGTERWANAHDAAEYVRAMEKGSLPVEQQESVTREMALEEELFLGLRKLDGIDVQRIEQEYGAKLEDRIAPLHSAGLLEREGNVVRLAEAKLSVSNEVFVGLLR